MDASSTAGFLVTLLVHSALWFAAAWVLARGLRSAPWRARVWRGAALGGVLSAALALGLETTRLEWRWTEPSAPVAVATTPPVEEERSAGEPIVLRGEAPDFEAAAREPQVAWSRSEVAVAVWALGALAALLRLAIDRRRLGRALAVRRPLADATWSRDLDELSQRAGLARLPHLSVAEGLSSPLALAGGEVVVPARALRDLARDEQRALLAHELAHLARRDPHWLAALGVVERVFWFQPLLRAAGRRASAAAELCCDEAAAAWTGAGVALARCLANVASWVGARAPERVAVAMAARGSALVERVERLLEPQRARALEGVLCGVSAVALLAGLACSGPTARESQDTDDVAQMEILRKRIDPDGTKEVKIQALGGGRFEITVPPARIAELRLEAEQRESLRDLGYVESERVYLGGTREMRGFEFREQGGPPTSPQEVANLIRAAALEQGPAPETLAALSELGYVAVGTDDAAIERVLARLDECPEAGIAFHVPYADGRFATSVVASKDHAIELRSDGTTWCGDMLLTDDRLLDLHLRELARCGSQEYRCRVRLHVGATFDQLRRVLQSAARPETGLQHFLLERIVIGKVVETMRYRLPRDTDPEEAPRITATVRTTDGKQGRIVKLEARWRDDSQVENVWLGSLDHSLEHVARYAKQEPDAAALIDADPGVVYEEIRELLDTVLQAGFTDIRFVGYR